jgi:MFS family permease
MENGIAPNAKRLLWAGFFAILAAGVGFAIRGGFLDNWRGEFGFTDAEIGDITGAGFTGFCFGIIIGGLLCDRIGYGKLVIVAFALHVLSAFITFAPVPTMSKETVRTLLFWGSFLFAGANGTLEAVANPLVATLFPKNRTHYLNILHASWPAGLVLGSFSGWVLDDKYQVYWKYQFALFLIPTLFYGILFFAQHMPKSEASKQGLSLGQMFKDVGILGGIVVCGLLALFFSNVATPLLTPENATPEQAATAATIASTAGYVISGALLVAVAVITKFSFGSLLLFALFVAHGLVGAVELGTDNWIQNITGNILTSEQGKWLFVFTSMTMFLLRFCADFIEKKIGLSPIGILLTCAVLACMGLLLTSRIETFLGALLALTVYGVGKTFFWPTMLAVASDRFPRTGAVAISIMGGIGMMSAGLLGAPGLGYGKDRFAGEALQASNPSAFEQFKADKPSKFPLPMAFDPAVGLDGKKLGAMQYKLTPEGAAVVKLTELASSGDPAARAGVEQLTKLDAAATTNPKEAVEKLKQAAKEDSDARALVARLDELAKPFAADPKSAIAQLTPTERAVYEASIAGDRKTLVADAAIPAAMAVIYLILLLYFKSIGGYKPIRLEEEAPQGQPPEPQAV